MSQGANWRQVSLTVWLSLLSTSVFSSIVGNRCYLPKNPHSGAGVSFRCIWKVFGDVQLERREPLSILILFEGKHSSPELGVSAVHSFWHQEWVGLLSPLMVLFHFGPWWLASAIAKTKGHMLSWFNFEETTLIYTNWGCGPLHIGDS